MLEFWLQQGVDGFNLVDYATIFSNEEGAAAGDKRRELVKELRRLLDEDENEEKVGKEKAIKNTFCVHIWQGGGDGGQPPQVNKNQIKKLFL